MTIEYTIAAIPTVYNGRQYRSRLEAKWAAFFDLCGWEAEYEPYDLGKWSPDFLIRGVRDNVLVEVKPITSFDHGTAEKIKQAAIACNFDGELLLLGSSPSVSDYGHPVLGWLGERAEEYDFPDWWFDPDTMCPFAWFTERSDQIDFCSECGAFKGRITNLYDGGSWGAALPEQGDRVRRVKHLWNQASNAVQWRKR